MAREVDQRLQAAYEGMGLKRWRRIDNSMPNAFEGKMDAVKQEVLRILGVVGGRSFHKKLLLKKGEALQNLTNSRQKSITD